MRDDLAPSQGSADAPGSVHASRFRVGGVSVQLAGFRKADVALVPSLEPFRVEGGISDIHVQVEWAPSLRTAAGCELFDSGSVWRLYRVESGFQFDFSVPLLGGNPYSRLLVDEEFCRCSLLLSAECLASREPTAPLEYPLDELLITHRLTQERAVELHGVGIVGPNGASNLFVGHSGAGKSTTARLWTAQEDVEILSDDRIILREHSGQIFMYGTPWHGEAAFASPASAPAQRICILEHGQGNELTRLSQSQAVAELFARSFVPFHRHEYVDSALAFLQHVAGSVPCYRYSFEPDHRAVERMLTFCD
ncbi:MAG: hypothetical protein WB562_15115 [Candidatus Sulfotelmatobacter sp.]